MPPSGLHPTHGGGHVHAKGGEQVLQNQALPPLLQLCACTGTCSKALLAFSPFCFCSGCFGDKPLVLGVCTAQAALLHCAVWPGSPCHKGPLISASPSRCCWNINNNTPPPPFLPAFAMSVFSPSQMAPRELLIFYIQVKNKQTNKKITILQL